jgi:hypothetical protein
MLSKAIEKIRNEMENNEDNDYIKVVGEFLIDYLSSHNEAAEKISNDQKTISKSLDEMKKVAEKKKKGNFAMLTPSEGFSAVLKYYEIGEAVNILARPAPATKKENKVDFDINLDDLL